MESEKPRLADMRPNQNNKALQLSGITKAVISVVSGVPRMFMISVTGVLIARYVYHVPNEQIAAGVGVPLVCFLLIKFFFPGHKDESTATQQKEQRLLLTWGAPLGALLLIIAIISLMSSGLYAWIGLLSFAKTALHYAVVFLASAVMIFVLLILTGVVSPRDTMRNVFWEIPINIGGQLSHWLSLGHGSLGR
ncbi:MAG: hypothetical protein WB763_24440 [Terriglobia bacterium]|jgi:hypothetical protein